MKSNPLMPYLRFFVPFFLGILATLVIIHSLPPSSAEGTKPARAISAAPIPEDPDPSDAIQELPVSKFKNQANPQHPQFSMQPDVSGAFSTPVPEEWEPPLFAILQQTNMTLRNQGLLSMATTTAAHVPRVQAECVKHLTYGLSEKDPAQFLSLARNPSLPLEIRLDFLEETLRIRRKELAQWLASSLLYDNQAEISALAKRYLNHEF